MLKGIPSILSPELLKVMMEMGHGDEIVIADGNYPKNAHPKTVVRADGHGVPELLEAILKFMPLDTYTEKPTTFMEVTPGDPFVPEIWDVYREIGKKYETEGLREGTASRFDFYEKARNSYALVTTGEQSLYANIILKKGVIK